MGYCSKVKIDNTSINKKIGLKQLHHAHMGIERAKMESKSYNILAANQSVNRGNN